MPQSELSDYINLQKEIKRLREDNLHLLNENKQLLSKARLLEMKNDSNLNNEQLNISRNEYDSMVHTLNQQVSSLKSRLETDKDRHQAEIIALQDNYKTRLNEKQVEVEMIEAQLEDLRTQLERKRSNEFSVEEKDHQKDEEIKELKSQVSILSILKLI
jgi:hypothetical protein